MHENKLLERTELLNIHLRLLLIEDNENDFILFRQLLSKSQFLSASLLWAKTIQEALKIIDGGNIDLILTDSNLPDGQGVETISKLNGFSKQIPIVVLTGHEDESLALLLLRTGAQDYLVKGKVTTCELVRSIRYSMERHSVVSELQGVLNNIKTLKGLLPICASCKKIRNGQGDWQTVESYIQEHSDAQFTHGLCPDCLAMYFDSLENTVAPK